MDQEDGRPILWFLDQEKVDKISNVAFPPVITATIANHSISRILVNDKNSYNLIYFKVFAKIDFRKLDLKPYEDQSLISFNDSAINYYG